MAVLTILEYPDARLKQRADPVEHFDATLRSFIRDLEQTMRAGPAAVGIAATQVGCLQRILIVDISSKPNMIHHGRMILVNPEIILGSSTANGREGCMSVPDFTGNVMRAEHITLHAYDERGQAIDMQCSGYEARAIQHELDHLDGLLFLDRLVSRRTDLFARKKKS